MKSVKPAGMLLFVLLGMLFPLTGFCTGNIIVYAPDTSASGAPPPDTTAILDGSVSLSFGTNHWVSFSNIVAGTHTVEVVCAAGGYLPQESDTVAHAVDDPDSDYGNPRHVSVTDDTATPVTFRFNPVVTVSAVVRDAWTMERLENATVQLIINSGPSSNTVCSKYSWTASYASNWISDTEGSFPSNTFLYATESADLRVSLSGYQTLTSNNVVTSAAAGDVVDLQEIFLLPVDNNTNLIADAWESLYFGAGSNVVADADADGDGVCNRSEYIAGTDPTNSLSFLGATYSFGSNTLTLTWNTESWRTYRICGSTQLVTGEWVQVAGSWEATNGQTEMSWTETNLDLSWNSNYRIEVMPCSWQGTNQVLVNTNSPFGGGGGSGTNLPPLP